MENVDTQSLLWLTYAMHLERRQATLSTMTRHAPVTSILASTHCPTKLSNVRTRLTGPLPPSASTVCAVYIVTYKLTLFQAVV